MKVTSLRIQNFRSFKDSGKLSLGPITLLVGRNNSGKSTLIRGLHALQASGTLDARDVRDAGRGPLMINMELSDLRPGIWGPGDDSEGISEMSMEFLPGTLQMVLSRGGGNYGAVPLAAVEPDNFVYPYLSGRKVSVYEEAIDEGRSREVRLNMSNIVPKVDRLSDRYHPLHGRFIELLEQVIGLPLSAISSPGGKQVGMWTDGDNSIELSRMGDGVAQMLGLIVQLCTARGKLFLIEELENDIHPDGLKALLRVIETEASANQFVLSTHSNIVVRHLGALPETAIYELSNKIEQDGDRRLPTSKAVRVENQPQARVALLSSLGYEFSDFDLYDGWLILEESSAERLIREFFIPWYAPDLRGIRTVASQGTGDLDRSVEALNKIVLFTHLQEAYRGRVRVIADGEPSGEAAIRALRQKYPSWPEGAFAVFDQAEFENYYPQLFHEDVSAIGAAPKKDRRRLKRELLERVLAWIKEDENRARAEFEVSAASVISHLKDFSRNFSRD